MRIEAVGLVEKPDGTILLTHGALPRIRLHRHADPSMMRDVMKIEHAVRSQAIERLRTTIDVDRQCEEIVFRIRRFEHGAGEWRHVREVMADEEVCEADRRIASELDTRRRADRERMWRPDPELEHEARHAIAIVRTHDGRVLASEDTTLPRVQADPESTIKVRLLHNVHQRHAIMMDEAVRIGRAEHDDGPTDVYLAQAWYGTMHGGRWLMDWEVAAREWTERAALRMLDEHEHWHEKR